MSVSVSELVKLHAEEIDELRREATEDGDTATLALIEIEVGARCRLCGLNVDYGCTHPACGLCGLTECHHAAEDARYR